MTVLCNAATCIHNSRNNSGFDKGSTIAICSLEIISLRNVEREDYKDDVMDCESYARGVAIKDGSKNQNDC